MQILGKILGGEARVKIMRLFLLNKAKNFLGKEVAQRARVSAPMARRELRNLQGAGFLKKKGDSYSLNHSFQYVRELENLLLTGGTPDKEAIVDNFKKVGKVKLLLVSGIFIKNKDSRADLVIVGDKIKKGKVEEGVRKLEAEIGTELAYAVFETKEFLYRMSMYDKLVRDILDFPHEVILQSKELSTQAFKTS